MYYCSDGGNRVTGHGVKSVIVMYGFVERQAGGRERGRGKECAVNR